MQEHIPYTAARDLLLEHVTPLEKETVHLSLCGGRVLAENIYARENIPAFDRSPYDGYAFRACDVAKASAEQPVTLRVLEEIPAGAVPTVEITEGTAAKILTGAPIPSGADTVIPFERTNFTRETVSILSPVASGSNLIRAGEDVQVGELLARSGVVIDPGLAGTLAAQGIVTPAVYRQPCVGILSTGNEIVAADAPQPIPFGKIRNSNLYTLDAAVRRMGCSTRDLGVASDDVTQIREGILDGLARCDIVLITGGVSVGDYDLTPRAMELAGVSILAHGVAMKPGMACAYGIKEGKSVCGLSGNPASSLTNFYAVVQPAIRKLCGMRQVLPVEFPMVLENGFHKKSPSTRLLRGTIDISNGTVRFHLQGDQGNVVLSSAVGCDAIAVVPAGSEPLPAGTALHGFLL